MSENERPKAWGFVPVEHPPSAIRLFKEGFKNQAPVVIWTKEQDVDYQSKLIVHREAERIFCCATPRDPGGRKFTDEILKKDSPECYICITLATTSIFFKTNYVGYNALEGVQFAVPDKIFKVQRRKNPRWEIRLGYVLKVEFDDPIFPGTTTLKKIHDISSGGMAIIIAPEEEEYYKKGTSIPYIQFKIRNHAVRTNGVIRHLMTLPPSSPHKGIKVGISFNHLHPLDKKVIDEYVTEETVKFNARFI